MRDGKIQGTADMRDETSGRTGQRLVLVLKRDAVPKVVLNNLYKHSQLQQTFGANMLALVDGVPRTLSLDAFIRHWVNHQLDVIARRTAYLKREAEERDHILRLSGRPSTCWTRSSPSSVPPKTPTPHVRALWGCWTSTRCRRTPSCHAAAHADPHEPRQDRGRA